MSKNSNSPAGVAHKGDEVPPGSPQSGENICPRCNGSGRRADAPCPECGGSGKVTALVGDA